MVHHSAPPLATTSGRGHDANHAVPAGEGAARPSSTLTNEIRNRGYSLRIKASTWLRAEMLASAAPRAFVSFSIHSIR